MRTTAYFPNPSDPLFKRLLERLRLNSRPIKLTIEPDVSARPNFCFQNVQDRIARDGGSIVFGWALWRLEPFFIEAEHHAVYRSIGKTRLSDITPAVDKFDRYRVFIRDQSAAYDFDKPHLRRVNVRIPIYNNITQINELIGFLEEKDNILRSYPLGEISLNASDSKRWKEIESRQLSIQQEILRLFR